MELRDLRALVSIAEVGTLSGAAQKLNVTQPALSAMLRRLEDELGALLVKRHSRGVALTEEGRFLLKRAYSILHDVAETTASLRELSEEPVGIVRIGLPTTVAGGLVPRLLPAVHGRYEQIQLHIVEAMSGGLMEMLQLGRLDLAMLFDVQPMPGLRSEPILTEPIQLLMRAGAPLGDRETITLEEVAALDLVLPSQAHSIRQFVDRAASAAGVRLDTVADVDSLPGLVGLVLAGYATMLPPYLVTGHINAGRMRAIDIDTRPLEWTIHLATRQDSVRPRAAMVVGRALIDACVALVRSGEWPGAVHPRQSG